MEERLPLKNAADMLRRYREREIVHLKVKVTKTELQGNIMVRNLVYDKIVYVRITYDEWKTFNDVGAEFIKSAPYQNADIFEFKVQLSPGDKVAEYAVYCNQLNQTFWDNNTQKNYRICLQKKNAGNINEMKQVDVNDIAEGDVESDRKEKAKRGIKGMRRIMQAIDEDIKRKRERRRR